MTALHDYFSDTYSLARERLLTFAKSREAQHWCYSIDQRSPTGEPLSIDVFRFGSPSAKQVLLVSSGTHGVEGFFGSAAQLAALRLKLDQALELDIAIVILHAVNPYGFSHLRRVNEDNIDLNRNFLIQGESYQGADPRYKLLDPLLNPMSPPPRFELFTLRAAREIAKHGFAALKNSVAQGQYDFERGLFFGGKHPSRSKEVISASLSEWIKGAERVIHLDLHTGLGRWGTYVMAASQNIPRQDLEWLMSYFDQDRVQRLESSQVLYEIRGEFTSFCRALSPQTDYYPILVEFGTYPIIKVLKAMRAENRATHWCEAGDPRVEQTRQSLREAFTPSSKKWRAAVLTKTLKLIDQSIIALSEGR